MVTLRTGRAGLTLDAAKLRVGRAGLTGTGSSIPKLRVGRAGLTGTAAVMVNPITPQTVEPEITVTVTATLSGAGSPTWTWRVVSGIPVSFGGSGATRTFVSPSVMPPGGSTVIGVTATVGGTTSPEQTVTITYLPQTSWWYDGAQWQGRRPPITL